ncbi:MAG TPA: hypothetical protein VLJ38_16595 [Polyangiaceae bacterium]|nr:hypothetical protein [Polyangiaceae bacterium]
MSDKELRLTQSSGATELERRLLEAAGREQPSRELSERMAKAIGVSMPGAGGAPITTNATSQVPKAATAPSSSLPWVAGALASAVVVVGVAMFTRSNSRQLAAVSTATSVGAPLKTAERAASSPVPVAPTSVTASSGKALQQEPEIRRAPSAQRAGERTAKSDLSDQLAVVDAAHRALTGGDAAGALTLARKYQAEYPTGTFRPEAAAIRIEALGKLGRTAEAQALAGNFAKTYGPGPLADRIAALAGTTQQ